MTTPLSTPSERLVLSRERLRQAMQRPPTQAGAPFAPGSQSGSVNIFDLLKLALPGFAQMIDAAAQWWAGHSTQSGTQMAGQLANDVLRPLAKRYPVALVAGAATVGALLIWIRPWRWAFKPRVLSSLGPVVMSSVLASGALQGWIQSLIAKATAPVPNPDPAPTQNPNPTPDYAV